VCDSKSRVSIKLNENIKKIDVTAMTTRQEVYAKVCI